MTIRKCRNGWHLDDGRGYKGICSYCILNLNHPTLRRINDLRNTRLERRGRSLPDLQSKTGALPMRQRRLRLFADYKQAASLLRENLVWSGDFDTIRFDLMEMIEDAANRGEFNKHLSEIVQKLISEENDLSI